MIDLLSLEYYLALLCSTPLQSTFHIPAVLLDLPAADIAQFTLACVNRGGNYQLRCQPRHLSSEGLYLLAGTLRLELILTLSELTSQQLILKAADRLKSCISTQLTLKIPLSPETEESFLWSLFSLCMMFPIPYHISFEGTPPHSPVCALIALSPHRILRSLLLRISVAPQRHRYLLRLLSHFF